MNWQGLTIIFDSLALVIGLIVSGIYLHDGLGAILAAVGFFGAVAWIIFAFYISSAMNSDI